MTMLRKLIYYLNEYGSLLLVLYTGACVHYTHPPNLCPPHHGFPYGNQKSDCEICEARTYCMAQGNLLNSL